MAGKRLTTNGIKYSVVGRYMRGSTVSGYHLVGDDGSQAQVTKNQLIRLVDQGFVGNCRVQMCNDSPLLRGKGIKLNDLPVYDENKQKLKGAESINGVKPRTNDPNAVFGQLVIKKRIMYGSSCIGYVVANVANIEKRLSRAKVIELAAERQIGNARIQRDNDKILLRGVGIALDKLPVIYVDSNGKDIDKSALEAAMIEEKRTKEKIAKELKPVQAKAPSVEKKTQTVIDITQKDIVELGKNNKMVLNTEITRKIKGMNRPVSIEEVKSGKARLYVQAVLKEADIDMDEFVTTSIKFGTQRGIVMRVVNRSTKETVDIREKTLEIDKINEKIALGIMCCGLLAKYNTKRFGILSIQCNDASSERAYEME